MRARWRRTGRLPARWRRRPDEPRRSGCRRTRRPFGRRAGRGRRSPRQAGCRSPRRGSFFSRPRLEAGGAGEKRARICSFEAEVRRILRVEPGHDTWGSAPFPHFQKDAGIEEDQSKWPGSLGLASRRRAGSPPRSVLKRAPAATRIGLGWKRLDLAAPAPEYSDLHDVTSAGDGTASPVKMARSSASAAASPLTAERMDRLCVRGGPCVAPLGGKGSGSTTPMSSTSMAALLMACGLGTNGDTSLGTMKRYYSQTLRQAPVPCRVRPVKLWHLVFEGNLNLRSACKHGPLDPT